jgi:hypothetical protein
MRVGFIPKSSRLAGDNAGLKSQFAQHLRTHNSKRTILQAELLRLMTVGPPEGKMVQNAGMLG